MINWIEEHPYLAGGLAVALVLVFIVVRRMASGGGASAGPSGAVYAGPSDQQIAAGTAVQAAQIQGQATVAGYDAQVRIAELVTGGDVEKNRLATILGLQNILSGADVLNNQTDAQLRYGLAALGHIPGVATPTADNTNVLVSSVAPTLPAPTISSFTPSPSGPSPSGFPTPVSAGNPPSHDFAPGETWDQYYASQLRGQPVNDPNVGYPGTAAVALRENIWAGAETAWINDPNSPHNLPPGDWYDASGHLQSGPQPAPASIPLSYSPVIALSDYSMAGMNSGAGFGRAR